MTNKYFLFSTLLMLISPSCSYKFANETIIFQKYLDTVSHEKIPQNEHTYLLIATLRCSGCVENALMKISQKINKESQTNITLLTSNLSLVPESLGNKVKVLLDKDAGYEKLGIPIANTAMIKTFKGKIVKIRMINLDDTDKIVDEEF